jgi:excisionase family DNA binding protein
MQQPFRLLTSFQSHPYVEKKACADGHGEGGNTCMNTALNERITISVDEAISATGIGKTMLYELLGDGSIRSIKVGKKRLIILESIHEWIANMECYGDLSGKQ